MVLNGPQAMNSSDNAVEVMRPNGEIIAEFSGDKDKVAEGIFEIVQRELIRLN